MISDEDLRQQVTELTARVAALEAALHQAPQQPQGRPVPPPPPPPPPRPIASPSLESRIGGQWLNRIGIAAVLIGMAWFLKLAIDRNWIGPAVRILIGLASAAGLVVWSERFRRQGYPAFSYSLKALGSSIAYLSLWAAFNVFHLAPWWLVFAAMTGITLANALLARRQNSEILAAYALAGGLATPGLLEVEKGSPWFLFSYLILLNAGALFLLARHPWKRLAWAALLGTAGYSIGWTVTTDHPPQALIAFFLALLFAGFSAVPFLSHAGTSFAFPIGNSLVTWIALLALFSGDGRPLVTIFLAVACFVLARIPSAPEIGQTHIGLGIFFVTAAVPFRFHNSAQSLCWLAEAAALVALAKWTPSYAIRLSAPVVAALAAVVEITRLVAGEQPWATSLAAAVVLAGVAVLSRGKLRNFAAIAFGLTLLLGACLEIHHYWYCGAAFFEDKCGRYGQLERRSIMAIFGYSACCMLYGAILITAGFLRKNAFLRWQALALFALSIALIFINGISQQGQGFRVLSFLGLGVLLLVVSFVYQKDWLNLRT